MIFYDQVYGRVRIDEPVILELINSFALQRLKGVDQAGYFKPFNPQGKAFSRFDHSLGVYLLLKRFGASLEEQIAGLIHDVSHAAFSHCIDYVLSQGSGKHQDHQDNIFKDFVHKTQIPKILEKHKISLNYILDEKNFPLKEKDLPDLCADRIDYSLKTAMSFKAINRKEANFILKNLYVTKNLWVFKNFKSAKFYAQLFLKLNKKYYSGFSSALMFSTVGECLKYALHQGYINKDDLYTTDKEVLEKIKNHLQKDKKLSILWLRMNNKIRGFEIKDPRCQDHTTSEVEVKSRLVDPWFKKRDKIIRLSDQWLEWKTVVKKELGYKEYFIGFKE